MADPTLATPALRAGFLNWRMFKCPPSHSTLFCSQSRTLVSGVAIPAPIYPRANACSYGADPTLPVPVMLPTIRMERVYKAGGKGTLATMIGGIDTAASNIVWPAPAYPHANTGTYP